MSFIVVTGAAGSIGSALLRRLQPSGVGIDIGDWDITEARPKALIQPDVVFHLAAAKDAPEGEVDPEKVMRINALGTAHVLARWPQAHVVLASTCKACDPETAYGASKLLAERMVLNAGGTVARFHNVRETRGNVFETWRALPPDAPLPVTTCRRYFISIDQALDLLLKVAIMLPGRYMTLPDKPQWMWEVAEATYPGRAWRTIDRRRGDRIKEPLHAVYEGLEYTNVPNIMRITSPHD